MDGLQDEARQVDEGAAQQAQGASAQVSGEGSAVGGAGGEKAAPAVADEGAARARADYEAALRVTVDGEDASADVGVGSTFFSLAPGAHVLTFSGCSAHEVTWTERWL